MTFHFRGSRRMKDFDKNRYHIFELQTLVVPHQNDKVLESLGDVRASAQLTEKNILHATANAVHLEAIGNFRWPSMKNDLTIS